MSPSAIDWAAYYGHLTLPFWMRTESADAGREVLIAIAAAIITVIGVVFSITILAVTFASQQFGPRMMRNFVRDVGNQLTLGIFVATFVYSTLGLGSVTITGSHGVFVPHLSITVAEALLLVDLAVLIYFIHHIARSVQLPEVVAGIARDLTRESGRRVPRRPPRRGRGIAGHRRQILRGGDETAERPRRHGPRRVERLPAVRRLRPARRDRDAHRLGHPPHPSTRPFHRSRAPAGHRVATRRDPNRWPRSSPRRT